MLCPCGSAILFTHCCQPYFHKTSPKKSPQTAEQLMRSRFSAYANKNGQYIYDTYAETSRAKQALADIQQWAEDCIWLALEINESNENTVDFSAYYIHNNVLCHLREQSVFVVEHGAFRYLDGDIKVNDELAKVTRNQECPCNKYPTANSLKKKKKYKHCCGL
jgi:SEC-C motif-containing protein